MGTARDHHDDMGVDPDELRRALSVVAEAIVAALMPPPAASEPPPPAIAHDSLPPEFVTSGDIAKRARISKATLYRMIERGTFPRPAISLGTQQPRWRTSDYLAWERERAQRP